MGELSFTVYPASASDSQEEMNCKRLPTRTA
jgi:hypothetical protein